MAGGMDLGAAVERITLCCDETGIAPADLSRSVFLRWQKATDWDNVLSTRQMGKLGGWDAVKAAAGGSWHEAAKRGPVERPPAVDVSGLDWDADDCRDTQPHSTPLAAIPDEHFVKGVSTLVGPDGGIKGQWIKTALEHKTQAEMVERLFRELPGRIPAQPITIDSPTGESDDDLLAVYPMGDPHIGMLSWAPETGDSFDLDIARDITLAAITNLVRRGPRARQALVVNLGDYFHSDNESNRTSRSGHALDVDGRYIKVARVGVDVMVHLINEALAHHERVKVINAAGNHDDISAAWLAITLAAWYRDEPRVEIDGTPSRFYKHRFGRNLIGVTHGHTIRSHKELGAIMADEWPQDWGETRHRWWLCGHLHHKQQLDVRGCMVEVFRTLAARDAYAANAGYGSKRDMVRVSLHREWGEMERATAGVDFLRTQYLSAAA